MNKLSNRIWLAAVILGCGWLSTAWVRSGYSFDVQPLKQELNSFPTELIGYNATELTLDSEVKEILNADTWVNRQYLRPDGTSLSLFAAGWVRPVM